MILIKETLSCDLKISKCPINCNNCKTTYTNEEIGFRIICECSCHENSKWLLVKKNGDATNAVNYTA
jgi:hypothetical protein